MQQAGENSNNTYVLVALTYFALQEEEVEAYGGGDRCGVAREGPVP